jgi:hypothetical protein
MSSMRSAAPAGESARPEASSAAGVARRVYVAGIYVLGVAVVLQFLFAGLGIFFDYGFVQTWHAMVGALVIGLLPLVLIPIGKLGGVGGRTLWLTASVFGLVVVQSLLLFPFHMEATGVLRAVSGLHVVNALLIAWVVLRLVQTASRLTADRP